MKQFLFIFLFIFGLFHIAKSAGDIKGQSQNYSQNDPRTHNYAYDKIGNLVKDEQEEIEEIVWDSRGKVSVIIRTPLSRKPDLYFEYDAYGNRMSKTAVYPYSIDGLNKLTTYYIYDPWGRVVAVYERRYYDTGKEEYALIEQHIYSGQTRLGIKTMNLILATEEGPVEHDLNKSERVLGEKKYEMTSHTGNVLAVVSDKKLPDNQPDVKEVYDYYPFGMQMPGRTNYDPASSYRYGFNRFEKDDELKGNGNHISWGDYGYDPRLVVRWSPDKYAAKYPWQSPYSVVGNNPILNSEIDGKDYGVYINHNTKTIIVKATYYTANGDNDSYNSAVKATQFWNEQSGKYQYQVGKRSNAVNYDVKFELMVTEVDKPATQVNNDRAPFIPSGAKLTPDQSSNAYVVLPDADKSFENKEEGKSTNGFALAGTLISIKDNRKDTETGAHEMGHTLGLGHSTTGLMSEISNSPERSSSISANSIKGIIGNAFKQKAKAIGTVHETGTAPEEFIKGKVIKK